MLVRSKGGAWRANPRNWLSGSGVASREELRVTARPCGQEETVEDICAKANLGHCHSLPCSSVWLGSHNQVGPQILLNE